jgi:RimJ/RimL family protein N-acetyltransferase
VSAHQPIIETILLEGSCARVRPVRIADAAGAFEQLHGRREVLDWLIWSGPQTVDELRDRYAQWRVCTDHGANYHFAVVELASGSVCGALALKFIDHPRRGEIGYWIGREFWGRGLATDAVGLAAWLAWSELGAEQLVARVFAPNHASRRVLEKNGFAKDAAEEIDLRGERRMQWRMSSTRADWDRVQADFRPCRIELGLV